MSVSTTAADARGYFDARAQSWEAERQAYYSDDVRRAVVSAGAFEASDRVLDFGTGSGYLAEALLGAGVGLVVAVDVSAEMLLEVTHRFGTRVEARLSEGDALPLATAEVDGVVGNMVLHHLDDPAAFFREAYRVLGTGGRLVVTDMVEYDAAAFTRDQHDRWPGFDLDQVRAWIAAAGFSTVAVKRLGEKCCGSVAAAAGGADIFIATGIKN